MIAERGAHQLTHTLYVHTRTRRGQIYGSTAGGSALSFVWLVFRMHDVQRIRSYIVVVVSDLQWSYAHTPHILAHVRAHTPLSTVCAGSMSTATRTAQTTFLRAPL